MKLKKLLILCMSLPFIATSAFAGVAQVEWQNPDDYRDIRPANESKKRFHARTFKEFEEFFGELAEKLPEGYQFKVKVTDIDLAGNVEFGRTQPIRIVRQIFFPRMNFEYQLLDKNNQVMMAEQVELKDMQFLHNIKTRTTSESLGYEKVMLQTWFNKTMTEHVVKTSE